METVMECIVLGVLFVAAWTDFRKMEVSVWLPVVLGAAGILVQLKTNWLTWESILGGALIGAVMLLIAALSRESIGVGDGLLFCATGACLGFRDNLQLFMFASFGVALAAMFLVWRKKYTRRSKIPFVPFVLAADVFIGIIH